MLDLVDLLKNKQSEAVQQEKITSVVFYQTDECRELVQESYRFEGIAPPVIAKNSDMAITDHVREQSVEIVIVELNKSRNVTEDARRISHLLPSHASVIIIGSEDAISTIRNLKAMGFYYLFWPITKQELIDFVRNVSENRQRNTGPGQLRRAKRVAVVGGKGGTGTSLLTAELAHQLAQEEKSSCIVVDHNYHSGNLDIMLGLQKFEKRRIQKGTFANSLDLSSAQNLLVKESERLSVLALSGAEMSSREIREYLAMVTDLVSSECHFILEDMSASSGIPFEEPQAWVNSDCIILVTSPHVSSVRDAGRLKAWIDNKPENKRPRLLLVVNHTQPEKFATVPLADIEKFLGCKPDVVLPFTGDIGQKLLEGKRVFSMRGSCCWSQATGFTGGGGVDR